MLPIRGNRRRSRFPEMGDRRHVAGKTSTLTGRFIHLVSKGADPARILAMTYTKKAADEMRAINATYKARSSVSNFKVCTQKKLGTNRKNVR
jgi:hypothetical protein